MKTTSDDPLEFIKYPKARSFPLRAIVALLETTTNEDDAQFYYLIPCRYLSEWLVWAQQQPIPGYESGRLQQGVDIAARHILGERLPSSSKGSNGQRQPPKPPGPICATAMSASVSDDPLRIRPDLHIRNTVITPYSEKTRRIRGSNGIETKQLHGGDGKDGSTSDAVAVPESFYELLRSVHGVVCTDLHTVSFQRNEESSALLYHSPPVKTTVMNDSIQPIEFKRRVIIQSNDIPPQEQDHTASSKSLMDQLLLEERTLQTQHEVEVRPIFISYTIENVNSERSATCLLSQTISVADALVAIKTAALPEVDPSCVRIWSRWQYGEDAVWRAVHSDPKLLLVDWAPRHGFERNVTLRLELKVDMTTPWPALPWTVGECVDAQDVAGHWYEAVVRKMSDTHFTVHYMGWASRWDGKVPRLKDEQLCTVRPLWSKSGRWRENLRKGSTVEVRDASSLVTNPKWYRAKVERLDGGDAPGLKPCAELEVDEKGKPLLLMNRSKRILVRVESEKVNSPRLPRSIPENGGEGLDENGEQPPYIRWVHLFGEEICKVGTHLKEDPARSFATLRYEVDGSRKPVEVMKSMHGAGFLRESLRGLPPAPGTVGLHNLGNSCFLNSILQCLNHLEPITQYFLQDRYSRDLNKRNPLGSGGNVAIAYASLLKKVWASNHSVLVPRLLKQTVANFAPQFDNSYQHDSHEFCQFLMDGLHEDLNRVKKKPYVEELEGFGMKDEKAAIESWRKHLLRHDSVVVDHCQGMHRSHLTCPQCGRESIKFDVYSSISLPIPTYKNSASPIQLRDCIEKFMEAEQLDERDAYYCPSCRRHVCALKLIALWSVPDILIIHLKRFTFDTCMLSGGMLRSKIDNTVEFPIHGLDLTKDVLGPIDPDAPPIYNLVGVSEHSGPTANSGHYTATVRNSANNFWYRCNDSHVGQTSGEASITGGAYLLFYQRASKVVSKWGGMHRLMKDRGVDPYGGMDIDQDGFKTVKNKKKKAKGQ